MKQLLFSSAVLAVMLGVPACGDKNPASPSPLTSEASVAPAGGTGVPPAVAAHILHPVLFPTQQGIVSFPPRSEPNAFFQELQALYRDVLRRPQTATFVDPEGQNVWLTEYFRFYLNGCSHEDATSRTLAEITTGGTLPTCGAENLNFPPRNLPNDFQNRLQATYRDVLRRPQTLSYVDSEGANVWLAQYLRFRVSTCDHLTAEYKVFTEIRGGGVQSDCTPPPPPPPPPPTPGGGGCDFAYCYSVNPESRTVSSGGGTFSISVTTNRSDAQWTATSDQAWLIISGSRSGTGNRTVTYFVQFNSFGFDRTAHITISGMSGNYPPAIHRLDQRRAGF